MVSNETFFAWLDGELATEEAARVEAEVAADPELTRLAQQHRTMQSHLIRAFDSVLEAPVPGNLHAAVSKPESQVIDFGAAKRARQARHWGSLPQWVAMAATLAIGFFVGSQLQMSSPAPVEVHGGRILAASALNQALDTRLASVPGNGSVRVSMTFRDRSGAVCRSFTEAETSGLACRSGKQWQIRGLFATPEAQGGDYRMAAGMDPNLAALVDSTIAGEPFDAEQEKAARESGWR